MLLDERRQQVYRALQAIRGLSREDRQVIAALDLPISDSLVVAYLKLASTLLARDHRFDWKTREQTWHAWKSKTLAALEAALRYHENEGLIVAVAVCAALFPAAQHRAGLMAYKILADVVAAAQRSGYQAKRERQEQRVRAQDSIARAGMWVRSAQDIHLDRDLSPTEREGLIAAGVSEGWGLVLAHPDSSYVMRVVSCVLPVWWVVRGDLTLITLSG